MMNYILIIRQPLMVDVVKTMVYDHLAIVVVNMVGVVLQMIIAALDVNPNLKYVDILQLPYLLSKKLLLKRLLQKLPLKRLLQLKLLFQPLLIVNVEK